MNYTYYRSVLRWPRSAFAKCDNPSIESERWNCPKVHARAARATTLSAMSIPTPRRLTKHCPLPQPRRYLGKQILEEVYVMSTHIYIYICVLDPHVAPGDACEVAHSKGRSNAEFDADRFRKGFHKFKDENAIESNGACSSRPNGCRERPSHEFEGNVWKSNDGAVFPSAAEHQKKHVRTVNSSAKWLRGRPEQ